MKYDYWQIKKEFPEDIISAILDSRNFLDKGHFLNPKYENLISPESIPNCKEAAIKITTSIRNKEKIGIFMDYDADGLSGGAILHQTLTLLGCKPFCYVPSREEGYGLTDQAVEKFAKEGVSLLICVDCAVKNNAEIKLAKTKKIETIVADHHELPKILPEAIIVHPFLSKSLKFKYFSGGAVAFMLSRMLLGDDNRSKWFIDLAAISTIGDLMPLIDDNRIIAHFGLKVLNKTKNLGLKMLVKQSDLKKIGSYEVGYMIAPRLNATGRISHPKDSFELLITDDQQRAVELARKLEKINTDRQNLLDLSVKQAIEQAEKEPSSDIFILKHKDWPEGIVGLIAGRVCEKFYRPSIVLSDKGEILKGSARSVKDIDLVKLLTTQEKLLKSFGGHKQAAGLTLENKNFDEFKKNISKEVKKYGPGNFKKTLTIDCLINLDDINLNLIKEIEKLEPFGIGNPRPVFSLKNVLIEQCNEVGKDKTHHRIKICNSKCSVFMISFNSEQNKIILSEGSRYDIAFSAKLGMFNNHEKVDLILEDAKKIK